MRAVRFISVAAALAFPALLSAASSSPHSQAADPVAPDVVKDATSQQLIDQINDRGKTRHLNATVDIQASVTKTAEAWQGLHHFRGIIVLRKSGSLRVHGQVPVIGMTMFDMPATAKTSLSTSLEEQSHQGQERADETVNQSAENLRPSSSSTP